MDSRSVDSDRPLFDQIDQQGDRLTNPEEKIEVTCRASELLAELGTNRELVESVRDYETRLLPVNALVLAREPVGSERQREGRGDYHKVPVGDRKGIVYVKGTGSADMTKNPGVFPGFPANKEELFFDELLMARHPRMHGTETLTWGLLELINASTVFSELAHEYGWKSIEEAQKAGVTIPLSVMHYKELSSYLQGLLQQATDESKDKVDIEAMKWRGNFNGLGSVSMLVPSDQRIAGGIRESETVDTTIHRLVDPEVATVVGRTLRELINLGFVYSTNSAHGQNLYKEGMVAQADNSDLVVLGDYKGNPNYKWSENVTVRIPARTQQAHLIFMQFDRLSLLTPLHLPVLGNDITWKDVEEVQTNYWTEMLRGVSKAEDVKGHARQVARLMPFLRTELNLAVSFLLVEANDQTRWEQVADKRRSLLSRFSNQGVPEEYERKLEDNYGYRESDTYFIQDILTNDKLPISELMLFLEYGDASVLNSDSYLSKITRLSESIYAIESENDRDQLLEKLGVFMGLRDIDYPFFLEGDILAQYKGDHLDLISRLVENNKFEDANKLIEVLDICTVKWFSDEYDLSDLKVLDQARHRYPTELLQINADVNDIHERCVFEFFMSRFSSSATPLRLDILARELINTGNITKKD